MKTFINVVQITVSILLVAAILIQSKGSGLGMAFGGTSMVYRTKRGAEKVIFRATIVLAVFFMLVSIVQFFV